VSQGWQLVVNDPTCLSGPAVAQFLRAVADCVGARFVVVDEVEGRGEVRLQLFSPDLLVFDVKEVVRLADKMLQFEWGDFFFVRTEGEAARLLAEDSCSAKVLKSFVAVRCVDNTFFYVYGRDLATKAAMLARFQVSESKEGSLTELDYPK